MVPLEVWLPVVLTVKVPQLPGPEFVQAHEWKLDLAQNEIV